MANIQYMKGDVTKPHTSPCIIPHVCNDIGKFGAGVAGAIAKKWPHIQKAYFDWSSRMKLGGDFYLGQIQICKAEDGIVVCNMIGQRDVGAGFHHIPPARLEAVDECLYRLSLWLNITQNKVNKEISIIMPRICCGLGGQKWENIEPIIQKNLVISGFNVFIYDL